MSVYNCAVAVLLAWFTNCVRFTQGIVVYPLHGKAPSPTIKAAANTTSDRQNPRDHGSVSLMEHATSLASPWVTKVTTLPSTEHFLEMNGKSQQKAALTAPLSEDGYMSIVKLEENKLMNMYIRRLCEQLRLHVRDEGALEGLLPHFSGVKASQSFFVLKQELLKIAALPNTWLVEEENHTNVPRFLESTVNWIWGNGNTLPLTEQGYRTAAAFKHDEQMAQFVKRVAEDLGFHVSNEGKFNGFVKFYSGTNSVQSFAKLRSELINAVRDGESWLASGDSVALDAAGYRSVAGLASDIEMAKFIRRIAADYGCKIVDEDELTRVAHSYLDFIVRSMDSLRKEVHDSCGLSKTGHTYGSMHDVVGKGGVLQISHGHSKVAKYSSDALRSASIVPTNFPAVNGNKTSSRELAESCVHAGDNHAQAKCSDRSVFPLGDKAGCKSREEQAVVASHRHALEFAALRSDSEWTAIVEGDVVPLHAGSFDASFKEAWSHVPPESKFVRLNWCSERDGGFVRRKTYKDSGNFRLIKEMSGTHNSVGGDPSYYIGGCTTSYIVHRSILKEVLGVFPCCCSFDCCLENQLFYAPSKTKGIKYRGEEILINMDAWDSQHFTSDYATFIQGGVLAQDHRDESSLRPERS